MICRFLVATLALAICLSFWPASFRVSAAESDASLNAILDVQDNGKGNQQAAQGWKRLVANGRSELPKLLAALDDAGPLAANWLRSAVDTIAQREVNAGRGLPTDQLEAFIRDTKHSPRGRRLAFEWLTRVDELAADRLIPNMLNDPSVEFRRDAVGRVLKQANSSFDKQDQQTAIALYRTALGSARDKDQIDRAAKQLVELKQEVDLPRHFGFLMKWRVIGPFDNTDRKGFDVTYPPEKELDPSAEYAGKETTAKWTDYSTDDDYGMVDLNQPLGKLKESVGYAWTEFHSPTEQQVELRLGCKNAWKLWLNGELVFGRDEYHRGMSLDQYLMPVTLRPGRNDILLKLCQNEQTETWTVEWQFQLRVCDSTGTAIASAPGR